MNCQLFSVEEFENVDGWHTRVLAWVNDVPVQIIKSEGSDWLTVGVGDNIVHLPPVRAAQWLLEITDAR